MATEPQRSHYSKPSAAALVVGLVSMPVALLPFGVVLGVVAVILGYGARRSAIENARPVKMANTALVMGLAAIVIWAVVISGFAFFGAVYGG
jgi:hypothetical protein